MADKSGMELLTQHVCTMVKCLFLKPTISYIQQTHNITVDESELLKCINMVNGSDINIFSGLNKPLQPFSTQTKIASIPTANTNNTGIKTNKICAHIISKGPKKGDKCTTTVKEAGSDYCTAHNASNKKAASQAAAGNQPSLSSILNDNSDKQISAINNNNETYTTNDEYRLLFLRKDDKIYVFGSLENGININLTEEKKAYAESKGMIVKNLDELPLFISNKTASGEVKSNDLFGSSTPCVQNLSVTSDSSQNNISLPNIPTLGLPTANGFPIPSIPVANGFPIPSIPVANGFPIPVANGFPIPSIPVANGFPIPSIPTPVNNFPIPSIPSPTNGFQIPSIPSPTTESQIPTANGFPIPGIPTANGFPIPGIPTTI